MSSVTNGRILVTVPVFPRKHLHQSVWPSPHMSRTNLSHGLLNPHLLTCLKTSLDCTRANTQISQCSRVSKHERRKWWVELWGCGWRLRGRHGRGREGAVEVQTCHQAAVRLCWPAACYVLQCWLASRRGVCKVGQHIIYLPPLFLSSVTSSSCTSSIRHLFHYTSHIPFSPLSSLPI